MSSLTPVRQQLEQARNELQQECAALEAQLAFRRRRMEALEFLLVEEGSETLVLTPTLEDEQENATEKVREIIRGSGRAGVRPRDITRKLQEQGMKVHPQFASNVVWRMKHKTEEVEQIGSRYVWKSKYLPPTSRAI